MFKASTEYSDFRLFKELGFKPFKDLETHKEYFLGTYSTEYGSIKVWVHPMPAQFWRFEVEIKEPQRKYAISTGSGSLTDFWPMVTKVLENMIVVEQLK